jgi:hypothetical protein
MLLSLANGAIGVLNASGFLLMAAGPELLEYIVCSTIFAAAASLYTWLLPAAIGYDPQRLPQLRLLQAMTVASASVIMLVTNGSLIGLAFVALMIIDMMVFPAFMLLFQSRTGVYVRTEFARGLANSLTLILVLLLLDRDPLAYVLLLLGNFSLASVLLFALGIHRPVSLRMAPVRSLRALGGPQFWSRQLLALLLARGIEMGSLILLGRMEALSPVLSLKIGMSISSALSVNARTRTMAVLVVTHVAVYAGVTAAILLFQRFDALPLPVPDTFRLVDAGNAAIMLPIALSAFALVLIGLRANPARVSVGELAA